MSMVSSLKGRINRVEKGCQAGRRDGRIIHHRQSLDHPEGYVRLFVEEGVAMAPLLRLAHSWWKSQPEVRYLHALLAALEAAHPGQLSPSQAVQHVEPPLEPFSRRERQVLRLLAAGLSNAEIAEELVISINTVRTHTRSLYHKLQVNNRKEALAAARHWKLL